MALLLARAHPRRPSRAGPSRSPNALRRFICDRLATVRIETEGNAPETPVPDNTDMSLADVRLCADAGRAGH